MSRRCAVLAVLLLPFALRAEPPAKPRLDAAGDPLSDGAIARVGTPRFRHAAPVQRVAFAPDGKALATGCDDGSVRLWETATGRLVRRFEPVKGGVNGLSFSRDGKTLLYSAGRITRLCDVATGAKRLTLTGDCGVFAPDGKTVVTRAVGLGPLHVWDAATGRELHRWEKPIDCPPSEPVLSRDGRLLAAIGIAGQAVVVFDPVIGADSYPFRSLKHDSVASLDLSADGKRLATGSHRGSITLWDAATGNRLREITGDDATINTVRFRPDGKVLAGGDDDGRLRLWDVASGREIHRWVGHSESVSVVAFSPDGKVLASAGDDRTVRLWDTTTGRQLPQSTGPTPATCAALSPDGNLLVTGYESAGLRLWDPATGKPLARAFLDSSGLTRAVAVSPNGALVAAGNEGGEFAVWEAATGRKRFTARAEDAVVLTPGGPVSLLTFLPDGRSLAAGRSDLGVRPAVFDAATGRRRRALLPSEPPEAGIPPRLPPHAAAFAPGAPRWAVAGVSYGVSLRDARTGREVRRLLDPWGQEQTALALAPDGRGLATAADRSGVRLWETATGGCRRWWPSDGKGAVVAAVAISSDGRLVAGGDDRGRVHVWHAGTGREWTFAGHDGPVTALAFAAGGRLMSLGTDGTALVWDTAGLRPDLSQWKVRVTAKAWDELADEDAEKAYPLIALLAESPEAALDLFRAHLKPADAEDLRRIAGLIAQLDDDDFAVRERASRELGRIGARADEALRKAAAARPSAEVERRIGELLKAIEDGAVTGDRLREVRALEVLEGLATPRARKYLEELANGSPQAALTREAKASLGRLRARP
jgi:WD40 repeat protein